ncbi:hypothetical protein KIW84_030946 [Lathyrus oleraceus]|uniref:Di19 zinc-binding domain-containing protein n=1 Tax=Pisum sativum TaxID=3888 RepID=A0A9D4XPX5_PEA|nr:hypothetical protein KIW84_030946 [Pisum sativum]
MENDTASTTYQSKLKSQISNLKLLIDFEEDNRDDVDDGMRTFYPCPFCEDDFDLLELCFHIDLEHPIDATSGLCPVCGMWVGTDLVDHITAQHGNLFKISFLIFIIELEMLLLSSNYERKFTF